MHNHSRTHSLTTTTHYHHPPPTIQLQWAVKTVVADLAGGAALDSVRGAPSPFHNKIPIFHLITDVTLSLSVDNIDITDT